MTRNDFTEQQQVTLHLPIQHGSNQREGKIQIKATPQRSLQKKLIKVDNEKTLFENLTNHLLHVVV
jgi:hypothetical protein